MYVNVSITNKMLEPSKQQVLRLDTNRCFGVRQDRLQRRRTCRRDPFRMDYRDATWQIANKSQLSYRNFTWREQTMRLLLIILILLLLFGGGYGLVGGGFGSPYGYGLGGGLGLIVIIIIVLLVIG